MMWSLTPQSLPCRRDSSDVSNTVGAGDTNTADDDETRPRFLLDLPLFLLLEGDAKIWVVGHCWSENVPDISHGSVATRLRCDETFNGDFITNLMLSLTTKEF